ncbi:MAG: hypothetical protein KAR87_03050 [Candidatus Aenigmarchaeota archaeon]|nr:hypothetical protein [Candidatus Aenigmarchaeota archaeon]
MVKTNHTKFLRDTKINSGKMTANEAFLILGADIKYFVIDKIHFRDKKEATLDNVCDLFSIEKPDEFFEDAGKKYRGAFRRLMWKYHINNFKSGTSSMEFEDDGEKVELSKEEVEEISKLIGGARDKIKKIKGETIKKTLTTMYILIKELEDKNYNVRNKALTTLSNIGKPALDNIMTLVERKKIKIEYVCPLLEIMGFGDSQIRELQNKYGIKKENPQDEEKSNKQKILSIVIDYVDSKSADDKIKAVKELVRIKKNSKIGLIELVLNQKISALEENIKKNPLEKKKYENILEKIIYLKKGLIEENNLFERKENQPERIKKIFEEIKKTAFEKYNFNACGLATYEMIEKCLEFIEPKRIKLVNARVIVICCICKNNVEKIYVKGKKQNSLEKTISLDDGKENRCILHIGDKRVVRDTESGWSHILLKIDDAYYDPTIQQYYSKYEGISSNKLPSFYIYSKEFEIKDRDYKNIPLASAKTTPPKIDLTEFYNTILKLMRPEGNICINDNYLCKDITYQQHAQNHETAKIHENPEMIKEPHNASNKKWKNPAEEREYLEHRKRLHYMLNHPKYRRIAEEHKNNYQLIKEFYEAAIIEKLRVQRKAEKPPETKPQGKPLLTKWKLDNAKEELRILNSQYSPSMSPRERKDWVEKKKNLKNKIDKLTREQEVLGIVDELNKATGELNNASRRE